MPKKYAKGTKGTTPEHPFTRNARAIARRNATAKRRMMMLLESRRTAQSTDSNNR